ncbi:MAG: 4Fe-4S dicluster domain-containing protein [Armatimonadetes bacterium]|nr:4Fe-4S dicluster domain-containing protein [Armatimonadota bacterium]
MITSKLKEALICFRAGRVTLRYPFEPSVPPEGFRGQPQLDITKCLGCGACSMACPTRCIEVTNEAEQRRMEYCFDRCSYCGECAEACPEGGITMSSEFELATDSVTDLRTVAYLDLVRCESCGEVVGTAREIDKLAQELATKMNVAADSMPWLRWCARCKRESSLATAQVLQPAEAHL